jgi:hypothetical protein
MDGQSEHDALHDVASTIRDKLESHEKFTCPIKHLSDGTPVRMVFWVADSEENLTNAQFGITVTVICKGFSHIIYNIQTNVEDTITVRFLEDQIGKARRIAEKSIHKLDGTLGHKKRQAMLAFGNNSVQMGIEACCVCAELTATKTACNHSVCIPCLLRLEKCPLCRQDASCSCCGTAEPDYSDDEFD